MISRRSSGSSVVASVVTPTRSQNRIVNWRRSTSASLLSQEMVAAAAASSTASGAGCKRVPHSAQNLALSGLGVLQWPQRACKRVPQLLQNLLSAEFSAPHWRHFIVRSIQNSPAVAPD